MFKFNKLKPAVLLISLLITQSGCSVFTINSDNNNKKYTEFNTNPYYYNNAKVAKDATIPKYIASNIENQPLYPIPKEEDVSGEVSVSSVPPSLEGKIAEYKSI